MIKERLVSLRGTRTQQQVADALGISRARYSHYENGRNEPDMEILKLLADFHHVTVDYLIGRDNQLREGKQPYEPVISTLAEQMNQLFEQEPDTYQFWRDFITASPEKRKDMIRTWQVMTEIEQKR